MADDLDDEIWPHGNGESKPEELLEFVKELADEKTQREVEKLEREIAKSRAIVESETLVALEDMPTSVLDGRLGEICETYMLSGNRFPVAYAWTALVAVASAIAPRYSAEQRLNLFAALVGPVHSGKSQAIYAAQKLIGIEPPTLISAMMGSAEALARRCKDALGAARLFSMDELGHMLDKSKIENASFPYILTRSFYESKFELHMGKKEVAEFNASLSILGGLVDIRFEDLFSHATTAGLYDRFLFGAHPGSFKFDYYPFEAGAQRFEPVAVGIHPEVWVEKSLWMREDPELEPRTVEIALRVATICASFDRRTLLTARDLAPAYEFAQYQKRVRRLLKPNEGENVEGKVTLKILAYLKRYNGKYVTRRKLLNDIGASRYGLSIADRALSIMNANGDIEITKKKRPVLVRLLLEEENDDV